LVAGFSLSVAKHRCKVAEPSLMMQLHVTEAGSGRRQARLSRRFWGDGRVVMVNNLGDGALEDHRVLNNGERVVMVKGEEL